MLLSLCVLVLLGVRATPGSGLPPPPPLPPPPVHCAFIHGAGHDLPPPDLSVRDDYAGYWGSVKDYAKCDTYAFMFANTVDEAWYEDRLIRIACATALAGPSPLPAPLRNRTIRHTVVFTHSMGNLVFAAALRAGRCTLGQSSWWAAVSPPWNGVRAVDSVMGFCNGTLPWSHEIKVLSDILHYCSGANLSAAYYAMQTHFPGLDTLRAVAHRAVKASICGRSADGIPSMYSLLLALVSRLMHIPQPDDGLVAIDSCLAGAPENADWGTNASSLFYLADINHADSTCRNGDSRVGNPSKRPCAWYGEVVAAYRRHAGRVG